MGRGETKAPWNKGLKLPAEPLSRYEVNALLRCCSARSLTGLRNRALIIVLYRSGLRISEALALKVSDVDSERSTLRVLHGKGNRARTTAIDEAGMAVVLRWIDARRVAHIPNGLLFCTLAGTRMSPQYAGQMLHRAAQKAGLDKRVHPHGLRHTHATELADEGIPLNKISKQLGHASSAVTARYIDHIAGGEHIQAIRQRQWNSVE